MKLLIMSIYFSFKNSSFEMKAPTYTMIAKPPLIKAFVEL